MKVKHLIMVVMALTLVTLYYCDNSNDDDSGDMDFDPAALSAHIEINGVDVTGKNVNNPNENDRLKLRAQFSDPQGNNTIRGAYTMHSHHSGMMMDHMGEYTLWDDGTHGDDVAGDGWYCLEDDMEHMMSMMGETWGYHMGDHEYEFYCYDDEGHESNHLSVHMTIR